MENAITAEPVKAQTTMDVYVVLFRYGNDYWGTGCAYKTLDEAQRNASLAAGVDAWRIVKACGLPMGVNEGEV